MAARTVTTTTTDVAGLRAQLKSLHEAGDHDQVFAILLELVEKLVADNRDLAKRYTAALRQMYRSKSERISPDQLALFLAQLPASEAAKAAVELEPVPAAAATKPDKPPAKKPGRKPVPADLRREIVDLPVPAEERVCDCGTTKTKMGVATQLTLEYKPPEFFVIESRREILACKPCQGGVVTAPPVAKPIEGGRPGPGLLAQLVTAKFRDSLPLYRQSQIYERSGITLAPSTLGDWCAAAADLAEPLWRHLRKETLAAYLVSLDDTGMPVLDRDHPKGIKRGHIWTFISDGGHAAFCEYTPDWKGHWPRRILAEFAGEVLQSDGYAGIDELFTGPDPPRRAGCMDHLRRRFIAALEAGDVRAAVPVSLLRDVYAVEREARKAGVDQAELLRRRQAQSRTLLERLHTVIAELAAQAPPKTPLGKAVTYAVNQWATLIVFLDDPRVPLSNVLVEQQQRRTALGRKNYMFSGSDDGARRLAILQTIVVNCELAKAPMFEYLRDVFGRLAAGWPMARIADLMPAAWRAEHETQKAQAQAAAPISEASVDGHA